MARRVDAVFLDRDGTINLKAPDGEYITSPEQLELIPGAAEGIRILNRAGVSAVVVTNQRGVALGKMDESDLTAVHCRMRELLSDEAASVDAIFYCPHEKGVCGCRKPGTLLLRRAQAFLGLRTLRHTIMIGDSPSDVEAGRRVGARTVLLDPRAASDVLLDPRSASEQRLGIAPTLLHAVQRELYG
jgi:D-glycero-D-manno-heptose 1,7-bisphosphate phosphatase